MGHGGFLALSRFHPSPSPLTVDAPFAEPEIRARRATVDDLPGLHALWQRAGLPWDQLERFVTEFILVPNDDGLPLAAIGLQAEGDQGLVHSEAILPGQDEPMLRSALWERLRIIARNQGIARLWTLEDAAFWTATFQPALAGDVEGLKATFADPTTSWWTFVLRDPARAQRLLDERMALWEAHRQSDADRFSEAIARIRQGAFIVAGLVVAMMIGMVVYLVARRPDAFQTLLGRFQQR
ncbi:MAG: hypothetical protein RLZZ341_2188 [Pseudomonadota bacterium]|jgi:N-acetylglutamate synthase-like GNAT family acetyltransferase